MKLSAQEKFFSAPVTEFSAPVTDFSGAENFVSQPLTFFNHKGAPLMHLFATFAAVLNK
ncbi:MAG: hypothetical protein IJ637_09090 [Prevotella sp.]|nr:hypothetical protein [Prevotella sp.]